MATAAGPRAATQQAPNAAPLRTPPVGRSRSSGSRRINSRGRARASARCAFEHFRNHFAFALLHVLIAEAQASDDGQVCLDVSAVKVPEEAGEEEVSSEPADRSLPWRA